jgi:UTP--glucose-1-phosphate uridylyltransferase
LTRLRKAVIPAAGLGTRMIPLTNGAAKELLPVGGKPLIAHIVEEALASGLDQICVVVREGKESIRDYLCANAASPLEGFSSASNFAFVYQSRPLGLGDALLQAREFVGMDPFVLMIPDQLMLAKVPAAKQLVNHWRPGPHILSSLLQLTKGEVAFFAGARGIDYVERDGQIVIKGLQTEDETRIRYRDHSFELRGFGRTVYPPQIFDYLGPEFANPRTGEVDLWKTFEAIADVIENRAVVLEGQPMDFGTVAGYRHYVERWPGV